MGDADFATELAGLFVDDTRKQLSLLQEALRRAERGPAAALAHRVKGASGNMGAERLSAACDELERLLKAEELCDPEIWVNRVGEEFALVEAELTAFLPSRTSR